MPITDQYLPNKLNKKLTVSEVHIDVISSYIGSHSDDWYIWSYFPYADSSRYTIQVWHDDIHQNKVKLAGAMVDLIYSF